MMAKESIFDTHTHLNAPEFHADRTQLLHQLAEEGIAAYTEIGFDLESSREAAAQAEATASKALSCRHAAEDNVFSADSPAARNGAVPRIYAAVGFHPDHVAELTEEALAALRQLAKKPGVVAVGEIGLDYYYIDHRSEEEKQEALAAKAKLPELSPEICGKKEYKRLKRLAESVDFNYDPVPEVQQEAFVRQLRLARELGMPINVHSRDAALDTYTIIEQEKGYQEGGIIHCFSYSAEMALRFVRLGLCIGIGGVLTFPNGRKLREVAEAVPLESIVLETDAPYMAPVPFRGQRNDPGKLQYVAPVLAEIKGISTEELIRVTRENAMRVYRIKEM